VVEHLSLKAAGNQTATYRAFFKLKGLDVSGGTAMQSVTGASQELVSQPARPAAAAKLKAARLAYLDNLRVILICLVILQHTAITYGASGSWIYVDPARNELTGILLSIFTTLNQAFFMGLFFFISGYFTPGPYDRKGGPAFWKDRLVRLGIPLVLYTWFLNRIPIYFAGVAAGEESRSFWSFAAQTFLFNPDEGPTWFLFALLLFYAGYSLWRLAARLIPPARLAWASRLPPLTTRAMVGFGAVIGVCMFFTGLFYPIDVTADVLSIFTFMVIYFPQYILFFMAGILAYRNEWLARLPGAAWRMWARLAVGLAVLLVVIYLAAMAVGSSPEVFKGGWHWQSAVYILWIGLASVSFSTALLLWLRQRKEASKPVKVFTGPNTFAVYLIHPLVLVPLSIGFSSLAIFPLVKFVLVLGLTIGMCFLLAEGLRRIPGVKAIL
jgi:glucans biosynthesis protein C